MHAELALDLVHQRRAARCTSRSILLTKVMIGVLRARQTSQQAARLRLDAVGRVDHHQRRVDRGQHAVGVFGEVLVARRVEQVDDVAAVLHLHHRARDRDAALLLDLHPVGGGVARGLARLHEPAIWIAPENSSSFSVSVVLPASGWEMMAKVRRRRTSVARARTGRRRTADGAAPQAAGVRGVRRSAGDYRPPMAHSADARAARRHRLRRAAGRPRSSASGWSACERAEPVPAAHARCRRSPPAEGRRVDRRRAPRQAHRARRSRTSSSSSST